MLARAVALFRPPRIARSPAEIAASVPKAPGLVAAETEAAELHAERAAIVREIELLHNDAANAGRFDVAARLGRLFDRKDAIEAQLAAGRSALTALRRAHGANVREALAEIETEAAERVLRAVNELRAAAATLTETRAAVFAAEGSTGGTVVGVAEAERLARRILERRR